MKLDTFSEIQKRNCEGNGGFRQLLCFDRLICMVQMGEVPLDQVVSTIRRIGSELTRSFST